ncbi:MAG: hypothetical protein GEU95_26210 [Rhizobiales bacterium]|nr:hypothetical protein [Hyphomicrobiales bacterium]
MDRPATIQLAAFYTSLVLGGFLIVSIVLYGIITKSIGAATVLLAMIGAMLVAYPIYRTVSFSMGWQDGVKLDLSQLQEELSRTRQQLEQTNSTVIALAKGIVTEENKRLASANEQLAGEIKSLQSALQKLPPDQRGPVEERIRRLNAIYGEYNALTKDFRIILPKGSPSKGGAPGNGMEKTPQGIPRIDGPQKAPAIERPMFEQLR